MGVGEWFGTFGAAQRISTEKRQSIAYRTGRIVNQLNADFRGLYNKSSNRFYVGSYGRSTAIPTVSDIDLLYELPSALYQRFNGHAGNGQSALLAAVRASIQKTYPITAIAGDGQVVVVNFDDGVRFEILPAFLNVSQGYTFADSNNGGSWRECKPKQEMNAFLTRNAECKANLVELSRMVRAWRDANNVPMSGMLIDTLAYQFIATWAHRDKGYLYYDYLTRDFFDFLATRDANQTYWLAPGSGSYVYRACNFQTKARQANSLALEALQHQAAGYDWSAKQKYREIYGTSFPS